MNTLIKSLTDLTTFEDACEIEGLDPQNVLPDFSRYPEHHRAAMIAHAKLVIITEAANKLINDGQRWQPDWSDHSQLKYTVWMYHPKGRGSSGFRFYDFGYWGSISNVGSRLCFKTEEAGDHVGRRFEELFKEYFTLLPA